MNVCSKCKETEFINSVGKNIEHTFVYIAVRSGQYINGGFHPNLFTTSYSHDLCASRAVEQQKDENIDYKIVEFKLTPVRVVQTVSATGRCTKCGCRTND